MSGPYTFHVDHDSGRCALQGPNALTTFAFSQTDAEYITQLCNAAYAAGAKAEKERIVKWLRDTAMKMACGKAGDCLCGFCNSARSRLIIADELEQERP